MAISIAFNIHIIKWRLNSPVLMQHKPLEKTKLELKNLGKTFPKVFKKITCPSCESEVPAQDLNINDKIGKCGSCNVIFPFHETVESFNQQSLVSQELIRPEGIDLFHFQDELEITIKGQPAENAFDLIVLGLATLSFIFLEIMLLTESFAWSWFLPNTLLIVYAIYAYFRRKNSFIHLDIDNQYLNIRWRPKKMVKDRSYSVHDIDQIYINKAHQLMMIVNGDDGQKHVKLTPKIGGLTKAKYLEQEIEKKLGITNRKVPEEV